MLRVKICGITNLEDAKLAQSLGADALGFIFYKKSPRYIDPEKVKSISGNIKKGTLKVGVFIDEKRDKILEIAKYCSLDLLQFHGNESPEFCKHFREFRTIKAFRIKEKVSLEEISKYDTDFYLFDTFVRQTPGGTGKTFDWSILKRIREKIKKPIFLSGGINVDNLEEAIKTIKPEWLDVSSSLEEMPGKKSAIKMKKFFSLLKTYEEMSLL
ncbi:MAG: phosphoribosylanthranilate isomerase [Candidatus Omnitrophica bacterium]|nr:phosphoribosylanthranilate isomerase [Candidatus Omnitrophota bacterium]